MNNISWRGVHAFIQVVEHGSFTAAAAAGGHSKANLSQLVSELESQLGAQLLLRTTRSLRLSPVGEGYYQRCLQATRQMQSANEWVNQTSGDISGRIKINCVGGPIGEDVLAPLLIQFKQAYKDIAISLDFSSVREDLIESQYDLVIRMGELADSSLKMRRLLKVVTRYVASPEYLARQTAIKRPQDLNQQALIYGSVEQWLLCRGKQQHSIRVGQQTLGLKVASGRVMRQAALAGLGVTRLADVYVQADLARGDLQEVLPSWSESTYLTMLCPPQRFQLQRLKVLMDFLKEKFPSQYQTVLSQGIDIAEAYNR